jgi:signal transduction histidine kinase/DNA-binding NarL/FixJ family response regulator
MSRFDASGFEKTALERRVRELAAAPGLADSPDRLAELARLADRLRGASDRGEAEACRDWMDGFRRGQFPEKIPAGPCGDALAELSAHLREVQEFAIGLARGDLSGRLTAGGTLAGSLKSLQASLRHLTWQTRAIAGGNLDIRVEFMGEFASAFNTMVRRLRAAQDSLGRRNAELERARAAAEAANQAKSDFLANVTHEIRTPMNIILGFSEVLAGEITDPRHREFLAAVETSGRLLLTLINDLLDLSRVEAGKLPIHPAPVHLRSMAAEIVGLFEPRAAEKGLRVRAEAAPDLPEVATLDAARLRQVLVNLTGNAVKFTRAGEVVIGMAAAPVHEGRATLTVSVRDTGPGIPPEERERIFEPFAQRPGQSSARGGSGLGLAIVRRLARLMSGEVAADAAPEGGARFTVTLRDVPVGEAAGQEADPERTDPDREVRFQPATVLVGDDVEMNRRLLNALLAGRGLTVREAGGGEAVLAEIRRDPPDLALLDLRMPDRDGLSVARELRAAPETRDIPLVAVTAATRDEERTAAAALFDALLIKPVRRRDLVDALRAFLPVRPPAPAAGPSPPAPAPELTPAAMDRLERLAGLLERELMPRWRHLNEAMVVGEVENFARRVGGLGREYRCEPVRVWGEQLLRRADSVDVSAIRRSLDRFPEVIEALRDLLRTPETGDGGAPSAANHGPGEETNG